MRPLIFAIVAACVVSNAKDAKKPVVDQVKAVAVQGDLDGIYYVAGKLPDGKAYSGVATIERHADIHVVTWLTGGGAVTGIGIRVGDQLSVGWIAPTKDGATARGVTVFTVSNEKSGPKLVGRWAALPGTGVTIRETLTFLRARDVG